MVTKPIWSLEQVVAQLTLRNAKWDSGTLQIAFHPGNGDIATPFAEPMRAATYDVLEQISEIIPLKFVEVAHQGQKTDIIEFVHVTGSNMAVSPANWNEAGFDEIYYASVRLNQYQNQPGLERSSVFILLHETLHALGLAHGGIYPTGDYNSDAQYLQDSNQYTVMSYHYASRTGANHGPVGAFFPATPMIYDIAALQKLYGANMATRAGDTIYGFNSTAGRIEYDFSVNARPIVAIWDGGGNDTIDLSGFATPSLINLNEGEFSDAGGYTKNVSIAFGVTIENAAGGSGNDVVIANDAANFVDLSRGGDDQVSGRDGQDGFYFGSAFTAADRIDGGAGNDQLGLQGNYAGLTLAAESLVGVETLALLSGTDSRFGAAGTGPSTRYSYMITSIDANVAAGQTLVVQAGLLVSGESLTFDGSAETDGTFLTFGGKGQDRITGGQLSDGFYFGEGAFSAGDRVHGNGGSDDQLALRGDYSAGLIFAADAMTGMETLVFLSAADIRFGAPGSSYSYNVTIDDGNVAAGTTLTVTGALLRENETLAFDGSKESNGNLRILGGMAGDRLTGGSGIDVIYGGLGADILVGGGGKDVFLYRSPAESSAAAPDTILLFDADDVIDLSIVDANGNTSENEAFTFVGTAAFTGVAGELRAYEDGGSWFVAGDTNGDGDADLLITLTTTQNSLLGLDDFLF